MDAKLNRRQTELDENADPAQNRSRLVHRIGSAGSGLFPGWGPKL